MSVNSGEWVGQAFALLFLKCACFWSCGRDVHIHDESNPLIDLDMFVCLQITAVWCINIFIFFTFFSGTCANFFANWYQFFLSDKGENVTFKSEAMPFGFLHSYVTQLEAWMSSFVCVSSSGVLHQVRSCEINFRSLCKAPPVLAWQWSQEWGEGFDTAGVYW